LVRCRTRSMERWIDNSEHLLEPGSEHTNDSYVLAARCNNDMALECVKFP
jgi:hypothetical protein